MEKLEEAKIRAVPSDWCGTVKPAVGDQVVFTTKRTQNPPGRVWVLVGAARAQPTTKAVGELTGCHPCGEIGGVMRYCIILANMVGITPSIALVYMVHVLVAEGCTHQRGEYCVLLTSTCCQHVDNVNFLNLSFGPCKGPHLVL